MSKRIDVKLDDCWVTRKSIGFGLTIFACFSPVYIGPVGLVWGIHSGKGTAGKATFDVIGSWVIEQCRRQGVRTFINRRIFALLGVDVITTRDGSKTGGDKWLRASGYKLERGSGSWYVTKAMFKKAVAARNASK